MICTRCPKIDLSTLSARITIKKAISVNSKKWSAVKAEALPLLKELESFGADSNIIHNAKRFAGLVDAVSWGQVSHHLCNADFSLVIPGLKETLELKWVAAVACRLRSALAAAESVNVWAPSACSRVLALHEKQNQEWSFYHISTTLRSQTILSKLELLDGKLCLKNGHHLDFITVRELFASFFEKCQLGGHTIHIYLLQCKSQSTDLANAQQARQFVALRDFGEHVEEKQDPCEALRDSDGTLQEPFVSLKKICWKQSRTKDSAATPAVEAGSADPHAGDLADLTLDDEVEFDEGVQDQDLQEFIDVNAGYGLKNAEDISAEAAMNEELSGGLVDRINASTLRKAEVACGKSSTRAGKRVSLLNLDADKAVAHLTDACSSDRVGLTEDEVEEEAFLFLVREPTGLTQPDVSKEREGVQSDVSKTLLESLEQFEAATSSESEAAGDDDSDSDANANPLSQPSKRAKKSVTGETGETQRRKQLVRLEKLTKLWVDNCSKTLLAILDASSRCQVPLGQADELSLVAHVPRPPLLRNTGFPSDYDEVDCSSVIELLFVKWVNPSEQEGRTVRVVDSRVVYAPAMMFGKPVPTKLFTAPDHQVLINCVGAASRRQKGHLRDALPDLVQRFFLFAGMSATYANKAGMCWGGWWQWWLHDFTGSVCVPKLQQFWRLKVEMFSEF